MNPFFVHSKRMGLQLLLIVEAVNVDGLVSGEVYAPKSIDGRREADLIYGYIHPCCAFPLSDCVIEGPPKAKYER